MQPNTHSDMTWIFKVAQDHYLREPGRQIDLEFWNQASDYPEPWCIDDGLHLINDVSLSTVPVLAAISLGFSSSELLKIIQHHGMTTAEFFNLSLKKSGSGVLTEENMALSSWAVHTKVMTALSLDPQLTSDAIREIKENKVGTFTDLQEIDIARLLTSAESLWPLTDVNAYVLAKRSGALTERSPIPLIQDLNTVAFCGPEFSRLSDDQIFMILERSGHLSTDLSPDNGFLDPSSTGFFKNLFRQAAREKNINIDRILKALNGVDNPERLAALNSRLIQSLSDFDCKSWEGEDTYKAMELTLDKTRYAAVFSSPLVCINLDLTPNTPGTVPEKVSLLALVDHLQDIDPSQFGQRHFKAINKAIKGLNTCPSGIDLHDLLTLTLRGLDAYTNVHGKVGSLVIEATSNADNLIRFVTRNTNIDYQRLQTLPSGSKALLVSHGLDIKKLPGINRRDKGHLLSDQLGL